MAQVLFVSNEGNGVSEYVNFDTAGQLYAAKFPGRSLDKSVLKVNGVRYESGDSRLDLPLNAGDRVSVMPSKVDGASGDVIPVYYVSNAGNGERGVIFVSNGTTVGGLFDLKFQNGSWANFVVKLNNEPAQRFEIIKADDKVSIMPSKVEGGK